MTLGDALVLRNNSALKPDLEPLVDNKKEAVRLRAAAACLRFEAIRPGAAKAAVKNQAVN
jgi:hypothetical protein